MSYVLWVCVNVRWPISIIIVYCRVVSQAKKSSVSHIFILPCAPGNHWSFYCLRGFGSERLPEGTPRVSSHWGSEPWPSRGMCASHSQTPPPALSLCHFDCGSYKSLKRSENNDTAQLCGFMETLNVCDAPGIFFKERCYFLFLCVSHISFRC